MITAAPEDQLRLLDVQDADRLLTRIAHRRKTLPVLADLAEQTAAREPLHAELEAVRQEATAAGRAVTRAEGEVEAVAGKIARNRARLEAGAGSAKDLAALQRDLETASGHRSRLEDAQLDLMEQSEAADARVTDLAERLEALDARIAELEAARDAQLTDLDAELTAARRARDAAAEGLPDELVDLYDRTRTSTGLGAARLEGDQCGACRMQLNPADLQEIRSAPADRVVTCPECDRILVRATA